MATFTVTPFQNGCYPIAIQLSCRPPDVPPPIPALLPPSWSGTLLNLTEYGLRLNLQPRAELRPAKPRDRSSTWPSIYVANFFGIDFASRESKSTNPPRRLPKPSRGRPKGNTGGLSKRVQQLDCDSIPMLGESLWPAPVAFAI
jgi:hypothetical protein